MEDGFALTQLVFRLGACLDEHRFADMHEVLATDITASTPGGTASGRDAVVAQATRNHTGYTHLQHVFSDVLVSPDGDEAALRANVVARLIGAGPAGPDVTLGGVYRMQARRTAAGWRLTSLQVEPVWRTPAA